MIPPASGQNPISQQPRSVLVSGAIVLDLLGLCPDDFARLEWNTPPQCVAFDAMKPLTYLVESCGGCAANIAYSLALLGTETLLVSAVGEDFDPARYSNLDRAGVDLRAIRVLVGEARTPRSVTLTDRSGRQFSFWAANGMGSADWPSIEDHCRQRRPDLVIVASNLPCIMLEHLHLSATYGIQCVWAPGGDLASFGREELKSALMSSNYVVVNDFEWQLAKTILGDLDANWPPELRAVVVTAGADGCTVLQAGRRPVCVQAAPAKSIVDPTGCGDAFVAGFAWGLTRGLNLQECAQMGSAIAAFNLEMLGTQCHEVTVVRLEERVPRGYGANPLN